MRLRLGLGLGWLRLGLAWGLGLGPGLHSFTRFYTYLSMFHNSVQEFTASYLALLRLGSLLGSARLAYLTIRYSSSLTRNSLTSILGNLVGNQ